MGGTAVPGRMQGTRRAVQNIPPWMQCSHACLTSEGAGGPSSASLLGMYHKPRHTHRDPGRYSRRPPTPRGRLGRDKQHVIKRTGRSRGPWRRLYVREIKVKRTGGEPRTEEEARGGRLSRLRSAITKSFLMDANYSSLAAHASPLTTSSATSSLAAAVHEGRGWNVSGHVNFSPYLPPRPPPFRKGSSTWQEGGSPPNSEQT